MMKLPESSHNSMRTLVVGAGKMGKLVIKHLAAKGFRRIVVVNRTEDKVDSIREDLKDVEIDYRPFSELLTRAAEADVIFTCTASQTLLFSKVQVYNVDDLKEVVAAKKEDRFLKAMEAQAIIEEEVKQFEAWKDSLETVPTIKKLRAYAERIRAAKVEKCFWKMGGDLPKKEKKAIYDMSVGMQHLRCDGTDNRGLSEILENMHALNRIFSPDTEISVLEQKVRAKVKQNKQVTC